MKSKVIFEDGFLGANSTKTSRVKPRFIIFVEWKINEKYAKMIKKITSFMRFAQSEGSIARKQYPFQGISKKYNFMSDQL